MIPRVLGVCKEAYCNFRRRLHKRVGQGAGSRGLTRGARRRSARLGARERIRSSIIISERVRLREPKQCDGSRARRAQLTRPINEPWVGRNQGPVYACETGWRRYAGLVCERAANSARFRLGCALVLVAWSLGSCSTYDDSLLAGYNPSLGGDAGANPDDGGRSGMAVDAGAPSVAGNTTSGGTGGTSLGGAGPVGDAGADAGAGMTSA